MIWLLIFLTLEHPVLFSLYEYNWETTETDFFFIGNKGS
jgi:hypothetical protein